MKKLAKLTLAAMALAAVSRQAGAVEAKLGGQIFASYTQIVSNKNAPLPTSPANVSSPDTAVDSKGRASFDVSRMYLIADVKIDDHWKSKIILEGNSTTAGNAVFLKGAFLEYGDLYGVDLRGGLIPTLWPGVEEAYWARRYVQKVSSDLWGFLPTYDKGVSAHYKLPMGYGKVQALYSNGEAGNIGSEATGQTGRQKDGALHATIKPMPDMDMVKNLELHGYVHQGRVGSATGGNLDPNRDRNRLGGAISYKDSWGHVMASYIFAKTGLGTAAASTQRANATSIHGSYNIPMVEGTAVFARYDRVDPGFPTTSGALGYMPVKMYLGGVEKKFNDNVRLSADAQLIDGKRNGIAVDDGNTDKVYFVRHETQLGIHAEVKF